MDKYGDLYSNCICIVGCLVHGMEETVRAMLVGSTAIFFFSMGNIPYSSLARRAVQSTALSSRPGHKTGGVTNPGPGPPRAHSSGDANHTSSPTFKCQVLLLRGCLIQLGG